MLVMMSTKMLSAPARTGFLPSLSYSPPSQPLFFRRLNHHLINRRKNHQQTLIKMSSQRQSLIEHVVLFKVKPDADSFKVNSMVNALNNLTSLNLTVHLTTGKLLRSRASSLTFTHMLHSRYKTVDDLRTYGAHAEHVRVVNENIKPIIDDIMAVDWITDGVNGEIKAGKAMRVSFIKLKDNLGEDERVRVLEVVRGVKDVFRGIEEMSVGENFSLDRAKGYTIASIAVLNGSEELEALDSNMEVVNLEKDKAREFIESVVVVDYVVPNTQSANL